MSEKRGLVMEVAKPLETKKRFGWTPECECGKVDKTMIEFGGPLHGDDQVFVCRECLIKAVFMIDREA